MSRPLVSVVLPFRNAEKYLANAIDSILAQDYPTLELVLIDDGSTDESLHLASTYRCDAVKMIQQTHGGVGEAFARGVGQAQGRIIACASADDISHVDRIARSVECLERKRAHVVSCRPDIIDHASSACEKSFFSAFERDINVADAATLFASLFYDGNFICAPAAVFDKDAMDKIEIHPGLMQLQDFDCWLRAAAAGLRFHIETTPWLDYRWHGENLSRHDNMKRCRRETIVVYRNLCDRLDLDMLRHLVTARPPAFVSGHALAAAPEFVLRPLVFIAHDMEDIKQIGYELLIDLLKDVSLTAVFEATTALSRHDVFELFAEVTMRLEVDLRLSRYRMRTLALNDALFLLNLRQHPQIRPYVNDTSPFLEHQLAWIQRTLAAPNDFSFVFERDDQRIGSASLYEIDREQKCGRMGRWLVKPGSLCAPILAFMGYDFCFSHFGLSRIYAKIPSDNAAAIRFQERIGASCIGTSTALLHGEASTLVEFELTSSGWARARTLLLPVVSREVARRGRRGEPAAQIVAARG